MRYCKICLNVDTRPNIKFDDSGLCPPCYYSLQNEEIDWEKRFDELEEIINFGKKNSRSGFDCVVGVSGGKDSTRQAMYVKERFKMNPLLVSMNYAPEQISQRGVDNLGNLIKLGFSCINIGCGPQTWRNAMKHAFLNYGNWAKATEFALFSSVPRMAIAFQIPLIWWGESPALMLGELGCLGVKPYEGNRLKYSNTLSGGNINWLTEAGISERNLIQYSYPSDKNLNKANIRIIFMDYFMKDFTMLSNGSYSALRGLTIRKANPNKDPDIYGTSMLDEDFININMYLRYLKFGFGRTSDVVNLEIRNGRMTREQGIIFVEKFDSNYDEDVLIAFCDYIGISIEMFWNVADRYVNNKLFEKIEKGKYKPRFKVGVGL